MRQVSTVQAKVIDCLDGKYSNWAWKAVHEAGDSEAVRELSSPSVECVTPERIISNQDCTKLPMPEANCNVQAESLRDKACNKFNKSLSARAREYLDNFPSHGVKQGGPFYLPVPAEVLLSEAERPKFQAMCEVVADGNRLLRAR